MWAHSFDLLGTAEIEGMRTEVRRFHKVSPYSNTVAVPANILSCRFRAGATAPGLAGPRRAAGGAFPLPGSLHFVPRSHHREFESDGADLDVVIMFLEDERIDFSLSETGQKDLWDPSLAEIINIVCREAISPGFSSAALLESCKEILVIKLLREMLKEDSVSEDSVVIGSPELARIKDYVLSCRGSSPTVGEIARICGMSRRTLLRRFQAATGKSPSQFVAELQFAKSCNLLAASNFSVKEVAFEAGFGSPSQFSRAFKRMAGLSPAAFQKQARD